MTRENSTKSCDITALNKEGQHKLRDGSLEEFSSINNFPRVVPNASLFVTKACSRPKFVFSALLRNVSTQILATSINMGLARWG